MGGCTSSSSNTLPGAEAITSDSTQMLERQVIGDNWASNPAELHISCEGLTDKDVASKSDPFAILYARDKRS